EDAGPVALEVSSPAERVTRAQADLARAERALRQRDFDGAWKLLDQVDAIAPNQAVTYDLRGEILLEQGKIDEAETALRNALAADPQLLSARYNLARVPFARKDFAAARKELEALRGAFSGAGEERREQLIRYQIYLTLLLEGREGAAQKAMEEFKMMDDSPALYYAQAAWAFQHGNARQGKNWVANAGNLFSAELNRRFAAPFADLGWLNNAVAPTPEPIVAKNESPKAEAMPTATATPVATAAPAEVVVQASPSPAETVKKIAQTEATPASTPEVSPSPTKVASVEKEQKTESSESTKSEKKRATRKQSRDDEETAGARSKRTKRATGSSVRSATSSVPPSPMPTQTPIRENIGEKVRNFFLYPFKRPLLTPTPAPARALAPPSAKASPAPSPGRRRNN
ncbi:MAG: tetratricopeptide repeat protein, partial [Chthoniobacterales bacterium]